MHGEKIGEWKYYLTNGQLKAIGNYAHDNMVGAWKWYREDGKLMQTGSFDNDKKQEFGKDIIQMVNYMMKENTWMIRR